MPIFQFYAKGYGRVNRMKITPKVSGLPGSS